MRTPTRAGCIIAVILFLGNVSVAAELQEGFMDYKWGDDISRYEALTLLHTKGDVTYYTNPGESYSIDDISIDDVIFGFYKEQLFAVYIGVDSFETYNKIDQHMKTKYGLPDTKISTKDYLTTYKWKYKDVSIKLKNDQIDGKMKLAFYYRPLSFDLNKEHLDSLSETSFRFFPIDKNKTPRLVPFLEF